MSTNGLKSGPPTLKVARLSEWFYRKIQTWSFTPKQIRHSGALVVTLPLLDLGFV